MSAKKKTINGQKNTDTGTQVDPAALAQLAYQTRNLLAFHLEFGISGYPAAPGLRNFLVNKEPAAAGSVSPMRRRPTAKGPAPVKVSGKSAARQLENIVLELAECRNCESATRSVVPGQGSSSPRLFVVGDCFMGTADQKGLIWGLEEDELFWKMMAAIGLDQESVYVTNCIKCGRERDWQPDAEPGRRCFPFLERELLAIQPGLICTMGEIATGLLLNSRQPLVRMRGRFHKYRYPHGSRARVMPTFHPRFLIRHPEMKRATWMDLQAVQRQLSRVESS